MTTKKPDGYIGDDWREVLTRNGCVTVYRSQSGVIPLFKPICLISPERLEELEGVGDRAAAWFAKRMVDIVTPSLWHEFKKEVLEDK